MWRPLLVLLLGTLPLASAHAQAGEEVPFITTHDHVTLAMLRLAGVSARDHVLDLGSGDGRIVITAARHFGASGHGVEIVPELVERSRANALKAGVAKRATFAVQDLFTTDLSPASVVTMYLLPEVNLQLRPKLLALAPGTRIVSHDWDMGDWASDAGVTLDVPDKAVGREKLSRLHLWVVPARVQGLWCAPGASLQFTQRYQVVDAQLVQGRSSWGLGGRLDGASLSLHDRTRQTLRARVDGERLLLASTPAAWKGLAREFRRAVGSGCP
jgi:SAM-dependent methyltransferase